MTEYYHDIMLLTQQEQEKLTQEYKEKKERLSKANTQPSNNDLF